MAFVRKRNPRILYDNRLVECDRCGFDVHIRDTKVQNGLRLDEACFDLLDNQSPRRN